MSESEETCKIFVPGRLCLLGEHTDWGGTYCTDNPDLSTGNVLVAALNEGLYARVSVNHSSTAIPMFVYSSVCQKEDEPPLQLRLDDVGGTCGAVQIAKEGGFFSYICGTVVAMVRFIQAEHTKAKKARERENEEKGIEPDYPFDGDDGADDVVTFPTIMVDNYQNTLPMKRGLSSSAAVCVMVVRAFDMACGLDLNTRQVMDLAYRGEMYTPSMCGRMDQCVAMGRERVAHMQFKGKEVTLKEVPVKETLYFCVADLNATKDTVKILRDLNQAFPFPTSPEHAAFHEYLTCIELLVGDAVEAIRCGSARGLGEAMVSAQVEFDGRATALCPDELSSPQLHSVMADAQLQSFSLAIKGVGSQGDGSVQVLCKSADHQAKALGRLQELGCDAFLLTIPATVISS